MSAMDVEAAATLLEQHPDFLVLRRIGDPSMLAEPTLADDGELRYAVVIDVETTGLDPAKDVVIEVAMQRFKFDSVGRIVEVGQPRVWREDPKFSLSPEIIQITGLTDADLHGQKINDSVATAVLRSASLVVAHNAGFDRVFIEKRLSDAAGLPWACSMAQVDWRQDLGFEGRSLTGLLMQAGWFYPPHRAEVDVAALLHLLAHRCLDGQSVLGRLVARSDRPTVRVDARSPDFSIRHVLKSRGYSWDAPAKSWWIEVGENDLEAEQMWLQRNGYLRPPLLTPMTARERYL